MQRSRHHVRPNRFLWDSFYQHSRTFSLAARLLPRSVQLPVATLYLFCRTVDTLADERVREIGAEAARDELDGLRQKLTDTLQGHPPDMLLWRRLARVHERFELAPGPLHELLDGAAWDLEGRPIRDRADLIAYADFVGGSVGAMMLPFLGVERANRAALECRARALGIGMQITNIVRDVGEDLRRLDRVYLPATWLNAHSITTTDLRGPEVPNGYAALLEEMMRRRSEAGEAVDSGLEQTIDSLRQVVAAHNDQNKRRPASLNVLQSQGHMLEAYEAFNRAEAAVNDLSLALAALLAVLLVPGRGTVPTPVPSETETPCEADAAAHTRRLEEPPSLYLHGDNGREAV